MKNPFSSIVFGLATLCAAASSHASVMTFGFTNIGNNSGVASSVASQMNSSVASRMNVDVWSAAGVNSQMFTTFYSNLGGFGAVSPNMGGADVLFVFRNDVGIASSISEIYFDDDTVLAQQHGIHNNISGFTSYTPGANPGNLPGGKTVGFVAIPQFSADAVGNPNRGIDAANDLAGLSFTLQTGQTYKNTIASLLDGSLRIGLHLRSIGKFSDGFVNTGTGVGASSVVPEPSSFLVWVASMGCVGLVGLRRHRRV